MIEDDAIRKISDLSKTILEEPTPEILASSIAINTLSEIECRGVILGVVQREGFLDLIGTYGYPNSSTEPYIRMPLWQSMPITDAVRSGQIILHETPDALVKQYPHLSNVSAVEDAVTVSIPVKFRNTIIGAIGFSSMRHPKKGFISSPVTDAITSICGIYLKNFMIKKSLVEKDYSHVSKSLTKRQIQIISLFKEDLTTDEMAERLNFSSSTIKQDIIKIYSIFGVSSRQEVSNLASKAGLVI